MYPYGSYFKQHLFKIVYRCTYLNVKLLEIKVIPNITELINLISYDLNLKTSPTEQFQDYKKCPDIPIFPWYRSNLVLPLTTNLRLATSSCKRIKYFILKFCEKKRYLDFK